MHVNRPTEESQMTAECNSAGAPLRRPLRVCPCRVSRPNWKAECRETGLLGLERGKGREALPIATLATPTVHHLPCQRVSRLVTVELHQNPPPIRLIVDVVQQVQRLAD